jgi:hypothetical protein
VSWLEHRSRPLHAHTCAPLDLRGSVCMRDAYEGLNRSDRTSFVGYSMPHPSEMKVQMRVQAKEKTVPATVVVEDALDNLVEASDLLAERFAEALAEAQSSAAAGSGSG